MNQTAVKTTTVHPVHFSYISISIENNIMLPNICRFDTEAQPNPFLEDIRLTDWLSIISKEVQPFLFSASRTNLEPRGTLYYTCHLATYL